MIFAFKWMKSPVGPLKLVGNDAGLAAILWENDNPSRVRLGPLAEDSHNRVLAVVEQQLTEYFKGARKIFEIPLAFAGTPFQIKVWQALLAIPYGETRSYGEIARYIGRPSAMRAVGAANGRNPIAIIAPCHRVIGASGALTGFAGGARRQTLSARSGGSGGQAASHAVSLRVRIIEPRAPAAALRSQQTICWQSTRRWLSLLRSRDAIPVARKAPD